MTRVYELSSEEVVQLCTALEFYIRNHEQVRDIVTKRRNERILSDDDVRLYNHCTDEIVATQQVYNKFRSN